MSKESLKKPLEQELKNDEAEVIQESEMELDLEDLDYVAGGRDSRPYKRPFPKVPPS